MSEMLFETQFPLETHPRATFIKQCVKRCVRLENASITASDWDNEAELFWRVDHAGLIQELADGNVELTMDERAYLYEFADTYADAREDESTRIEGEN